MTESLFTFFDMELGFAHEESFDTPDGWNCVRLPHIPPIIYSGELHKRVVELYTVW